MPTANSGSEVPKATTVAPIIKGGTLNFFPKSSAMKTKYFADFKRIISEITRIMNQIKMKTISGIKLILTAKLRSKFHEVKSLAASATTSVT